MSRLGVQSWHERLWRLFQGTRDISTGAVRTVPDRPTQFGEVMTSARTPVIELNSAYGLTAIRDVFEATGTGSVANHEGSIRLSTGTDPNSSAILNTAEIGRYVPGYSAEIGIGVQLGALPEGDQEIIFGGLTPSGNDGFLFGCDANGMFIAVVRDGIRIQQVYQQDWNQDPMDGSGLSRFNIDIRDGLVFQIEYTWYGYGLITFGVLGTITDEQGRQRQRFLPFHHYRPEGQTSVERSNLRLTVDLKNGAGGGNIDAFVGGRQYSIVGRYIPKYRYCHAWRDAVATSTTMTPLVSLRRKADFDDRSIKFQGIEAIATGQTHVVAVYLDATVTGGSWVNPPEHTAAETALEANISATGVSGGVLIWQGIIDGAQNVSRADLARQAVDLDIPDGQSLTLAARTISGTGSVIGALRATEEW